MKNIAKDLTTIANKMNGLAVNIEQLAKMVADPPEAPKKAAKRMQTMQKKNLTPTDQVLIIMKRFKKGITVAALREKSGLTEKQISNVVHRACQKDKMKRVGRGVYSVYGL